MEGRGAVFRALAGNRALLRVVAAYTLFTLAESAVWMAMLVYAFEWGGTTAAGLVALAQLVPAALLAPLLSALASRRSPVVLLAVGYLAQAAGMGATVVGAILGVPAVTVAAAVVTSVAFTATRPAQSTLFPSLAATPDQLTAVNVITGWVEAAGFAVAGSLTGLLIWLSGVAGVFAAGALCGLAAARLVAGLRVPSLAAPGADDEEDTPGTGLRSSIRLAAREPRLRLMLALMTAQSIVSGALDLLFVILAVGVLGRSSAWVGYLNAADGLGAIVAAAFSVLLIGRRLSMPILVAALLPLAAGAGGRALIRADSAAPVPVVQIALLRSIPRTATVTARTGALVYELAREPFLTAVLGHPATGREANGIADRLLAADAVRDSPDPTT
jgi:MFS family permease